MKLIFHFSILILFTMSCSSLSITTIKEGSLTIEEGRYGELDWNEDLKFKRTSWYYELTLLYDFLIAEIPIHSNYRRWFTATESISANSCGKFYIAGVYASRDKRVNQNDIWKVFDTNKVKFINVNGFYKNLSFSEKFITNSFGLYKFWGICVESIDEQIDMEISFPGYRSKQITL
jgi:hypothetical protein